MSWSSRLGGLIQKWMGEADRHRRWPKWLSPLILFGLTVSMLGGVFVSAGDEVLSTEGGDLAGQYAYWRQFGFDELRHGHVALWNPHVFSGTPFMGAFQSALFYPLNWIYLALPLAPALNLEIVMHVFLMGLFMNLWARRRGLHPFASLVAASLTMFGGAYFLRVLPGHLTMLDSLAWAPLILLTLD